LIAVVPAYDDNPSSDDIAGAIRAILAMVREHSSGLAAAGSAAATSSALRRLNGDLRQLVETVSTARASHLVTVDGVLRAEAVERLDAVTVQLGATGAMLDLDRPGWSADEVERLQNELRLAQDLAWTMREDRLRAAERVLTLAACAADLPLGASIAYFALDTVLEALDRLEVRGRDSAGIHLWVQLSHDDMAALPAGTLDREDALFRSGTLTRLTAGLSVVYKTAAMVGQLGDNVRALRADITADPVLRDVLSLPSAKVTVVAHTRWASVGRVSQPNTHPLNSEVRDDDTASRYTVAALNGDIDNYLEIGARERLALDPDITTDAKLIPVMVGHRLAAGATDIGAVCHECLRSYRGSMAICVQTEVEPDRLLLGVKGGGQGLYVGLSPVGYLVASEVFGLVSHANRYLRVEPDVDDGTGGAVVSVDLAGNGSLAGIRRVDAAGRTHAVPDSALRVPEVATRDVTRGGYERYLEKELADAPSSFRKTLRGRIHDRDGQLSVYLAESTLPDRIRRALRDGSIDEIVLIGQGTAAVAASGIAYLMDSLVDTRIRVRSLPATELSAWQLHRDLSRSLVIPISQSGTTTDTNRTVDLVRERGARIVAIVNRRDSDLVTKSDGVLYTSDGRDIEMAVASTKAFYAQVAAGMLLGIGIAKEIGVLDEHAEDSRLRLLTEMPGKLEQLEKTRATIAAVAERTACQYRYSAVLGSGPNRIAAAEVRIKLSELCYRGVSSDAVEDKKHIDLSAESLVLVCAAGTPVTQTHDLVKEVDIFTAHRNQPVVIIDAGTRHLWSTDLVIEVPATHPTLAWLLSTAAGHYFAYYTARAIDSAADDLRFALTALDSIQDGGRALAAVRLDKFVDDTELGRYRGVLGSDTALRLIKARWLLDGRLPIQQLFPDDSGGRAADPMEIIRRVLTAAIDELSRSIDSVKHQAKTVTVGTSRSGADLFDSELTKAVLDLGVDRESLSYHTLLALRDYDGVTADVRGAVRYTVTGTAAEPRIRTVRKVGMAANLPSRADRGTAFAGTKRLAADTGTVRLERGQSDGRLVLIIPEQSGSRVAGISLLHVELADRTTAEALMAALDHQGTRLPELRAAITELDRPFSPGELAELGPAVVLLDPISAVAAAVTSRH
jgi:glucosamine--fructose-6-phosphate aminotransferase (isomerizing)